MKFAKVSTEPPGPKAFEVIDTMKKSCYDSTFTYPLVIAGGSGCVIRDVDGNSFLDFTSNIGACPLGYSHSDVVAVIAEMAKNGIHKIAGQDFYCQEHADLAQQGQRQLLHFRQPWARAQRRAHRSQQRDIEADHRWL